MSDLNEYTYELERQVSALQQEVKALKALPEQKKNGAYWCEGCKSYHLCDYAAKHLAERPVDEKIAEALNVLEVYRYDSMGPGVAALRILEGE